MKKFIGYEKGVDFGGWLSQCSEYTTAHYEEFITEKDFEVVASWACDHIRLPVDYQVFQNEDGSFIERGFTYVENAISWAKKNKLNLILDLHKTLGFSFDHDMSSNSFFDSTELQEYFYTLWEEFARRFAKNEEMLSFELLNEVTSPSYSDKWNKIAAQVIKRIRAIAPTIKILLGGYWNNSIDALKDLDKPVDKNIVYNFHCYDPLLFTHQGAYWVAGMPQDFRLEYPTTFKKHNEAARKYNFKDFIVRDGEEGSFDRNYFINKFMTGVKLCEERDVALYCGEYGVINNASPEDTLKWYKDINAAFKEYGIGRACWSYKSMSFGLVDDNMKGVLSELVKYL